MRFIARFIRKMIGFGGWGTPTEFMDDVIRVRLANQNQNNV